MITLSLPDGATRELKTPVSGLDFAESISKSLAKKAVAIKVDGEMKDLTAPLDHSAAVEIVTRETPDGVDLLRHDAAHVMAQAVQELYPGVQVTIGPTIENGFYYDFATPTPFRPEDLPRIEERMHEIVARDDPITREVWNRDKAITHFKKQGEHYKAEIIADLPADEEISVYRQGDWLDLCRGPHLPSTGRLGKAFRLTRIAGAYWRGDSANEMLQRIYGTAWADEKDLQAHLTMMEEAEKRDHRRIGKQMGLFHMQEEAAGMVFWHPDGWTLYRALEGYMRRRLTRAGYREVRTPQLADRRLWEASGHWEKFREHMFVTETEDDSTFALKPMNCPCHVQIFNHGLKSYRDLPLRMAEFGSCHRYEPSGALHGLMRVRGFVQDDAHIFCTEDQIASETAAFCTLLGGIYRDLGFEDIRVKFADRPAVRTGEDAIWDQAEAALRQAAQETGLPYEEDPGEGAFYGPKLDFHLRDAIGRLWQCGTLQADFNLPDRLGASYIGEDGGRHVPVMLHRAILGSLERFLGILIEHHEGRFPMWLAPVQVVVATITSEADEYAHRVCQRLTAAGLRTATDLRNEKIAYKVREHSERHIPALLVVGKRESAEESVSVRRLGSDRQTGMSLEEAAALLAAEAQPPDKRAESQGSDREP